MIGHPCSFCLSPKSMSVISPIEDLLKRYDTSGPRYTSYPPAPHFRDGFPVAHYEAILKSLRDEGSSADGRLPISLYFHLPFCDTLCYFCGCNMLISNDRAKIHNYVEYLKREIRMVADRLGEKARYRVTQMHWGGGSPTHLLPSEMEDLGLYIRETFHFDDRAEVSIEVDPRGFTEEHAAALKAVGFNRASVGVQDFFPDTQWAVNRIQPYELTANVIKMLRKSGVKSLNIDLIYGLPYQTVGTFRTTLDQVLTLSPDRLAVYNFAYVPWVKPHQKVIQIDTLPQADKKIALQYTSIERFTQAGFEYIGMDHYARSDDELARAQKDGTLQRNFQGYSTKGGTTMIGFGISSIGKIKSSTIKSSTINAAGTTTFIQNVKELDRYYAAIDAGTLPVDKGYEMTKDDLLRECVISQIMCHLSVNVKSIEHHYEIDFETYFAGALQQLAPMINDRLIDLRRVDGVLQEIVVSKLGKLFLRNIAMAFDAYLPGAGVLSPSAQERPAALYSRTI